MINEITADDLRACRSALRAAGVNAGVTRQCPNRDIPGRVALMCLRLLLRDHTRMRDILAAATPLGLEIHPECGTNETHLYPTDRVYLRHAAGGE